MYVTLNGRSFPAHPVYPTSTSIAARIREIIRESERVAATGKKQYRNYHFAEVEALKAALRELANVLDSRS